MKICSFCQFKTTDYVEVSLEAQDFQRMKKILKNIKNCIDKDLKSEYTIKRGEDITEVTPVPIPNTEVKLRKADDSQGMPLVKIGIRHALYSSLAQLVERPAVNRQVVGSSPTRGAIKKCRQLCYLYFFAGRPGVRPLHYFPST